MKTNIGIPEKNLKGVIEVLTGVLSDAMILYTKTRKFHWNVAGESFMEYHKLFETQYQELEQAVDEIAERIGKLGGNTIGSMEEFLKHGTLKESAGQYPTSKEMLTQLLKDHEAVAIALRKAIEKCDEEYDDVGTVDFLTTLLEHHESTAWMLRRYLS